MAKLLHALGGFAEQHIDEVHDTKSLAGNWQCADNQFRRNVDLVFLSVGGNDIGFANLVGWATVRNGASAKLAKFFGQTVSAEQFADNMKNILPEAYQKLARALEKAIPLHNGEMAFDPARVILTAYPDILADETGRTCTTAGAEGQPDDQSGRRRRSKIAEE